MGIKKKIKCIIIVNDDFISDIVFSKLVNNKRLEILAIISYKGITGNHDTLSKIKLIFNMSLKFSFFYIFLIMTSKVFRFFSKKLGIGEIVFLEKIAKERKILFFKINFKPNEFLYDILKRLRPEVVFTRAGFKIDQKNMKIPSFGIWCTHSGILPNYKGVASEFYSMIQNEKFIGSSLFKINEFLDSPSVIFLKKFSLNKNNSLFYNIIKNNLILADFLDLKLSNILKKDYSIQKSYPKKKYYGWPQKIYMKKFSEKNKIMSINEILKFLLKRFNKEDFK